MQPVLDDIMVGLSYCLDGTKCCYWRTKYQKVDRKFKGVIRKIVKRLKKDLKSICDSVCINKDEVYKVKFLIKVISGMEPKQLLILKLNRFCLIVWSGYAVRYWNFLKMQTLYKSVDSLGMNHSLCNVYNFEEFT